MNIHPISNNAFHGGKLTVNVRKANSLKPGFDTFNDIVTIDVDHIKEIDDTSIMVDDAYTDNYGGRSYLFYDNRRKDAFHRLISAFGALQAAKRDDIEIYVEG